MIPNDIFIVESASLIEALKKLDDTGVGILFVIDQNGKFVATLTDGDIRRCLLESGSLDNYVKNAAEYNPIYIYEGQDANANDTIRRFRLKALPILSKDGMIVDCVFNEGINLKSYRYRSIDLPVVMMAGGLGTRLYPYTKILPKALVPVNDIPIAERIIDHFMKNGCIRFYLVVNHKKQMIKAYFSEKSLPCEIEFIEEEDFLGTGGGLALLKDKLTSTFILTNCDILIDADYSEALALHQKNHDAVSIFASLKNYVIPYGTIEIEAGGSVVSMEEKPAFSAFVNTGCYIVEPEVFSFIEEGESIGFPDVITRAQKAGLNVSIYPISERSWLDMGQIDGLKDMSEQLSSWS